MKNKTVGIVTILKVNNYGAELQAFALQHKLELMGYDAEIIDYLFYKHPRHRREGVSKPFYPFPLKGRIREWLLPLYESLRCLPYAKQKAQRRERFEAFHRKHTRFSAKTYTRQSSLYASPPDYDIYVAGSDQVWNPNCYTSLNPYFLTFAPAGKRRVSYASSFGVSALPATAEAGYKRGLEGLDAIAVREHTGARLVKQLTGRDATVVADPTLLLSGDEWLRVASLDKVPSQAYLLLYVLHNSDYITRTAQQLAQERGLKIVRLCKNAYRQDACDSGIENVLDAAPDDFIGLFSRATLVLTNSFHGTVFSNIFHRDFYAIVPRGKDNNSRLVDLLGRIGNTDRLRYEGDVFKPGPPVDWPAIDEQISALVHESEDYIKRTFL